MRLTLGQRITPQPGKQELLQFSSSSPTISYSVLEYHIRHDHCLLIGDHEIVKLVLKEVRFKEAISNFSCRDLILGQQEEIHCIEVN
jgi:hypothetical protein